MTLVAVGCHPQSQIPGSISQRHNVIAAFLLLKADSI